MTMAQSNSMGAKSDLLVQLFRCRRLWMCAFCPSCLPLWFSLTMLFSFSLVFFFFVVSSSCLVFFALPHLFVFSCPFYLLLSSPFSFFSFMISLSLCSQLSVIRLSMSESILSYCLPLLSPSWFISFFSHYSVQCLSIVPSPHPRVSPSAYVWF